MRSTTRFSTALCELAARGRGLPCDHHRSGEFAKTPALGVMGLDGEHDGRARQALTATNRGRLTLGILGAPGRAHPAAV